MTSSPRITIPNGDIARLTIAIERAIPMLPAETREKLRALLNPAALGSLVAIIVIWGGSHFIGVGEAADVFLLGVGVVTFGREAIDIGKRFAAFARFALTARTDSDIDQAAKYFASALTAVGVDSLIIILTHRVASGARVATQGIAASARVADVTGELRLVIDDSDGVLDRLVGGAREPSEKEELLAWLERLQRQVQNFNGRPRLRVTKAEERWIRASDTFDEPGATGQVRDRVSGRNLTARDDGAYLAESSDRAGSAVLSPWNRMNMVEEQIVPSGSVVLDGTAAPQASGGAWARGGESLAGGGRQIFHAGQITPEWRILGAVRRTGAGYATRPNGTRLRDH
jgi:hypothetical protein